MQTIAPSTGKSALVSPNSRAITSTAAPSSAGIA